MNIPIEQCVSARPYKVAPERRMLLTALIVLLYAVSIPYCYITSGEPRKIAMIHAQKLADEKWEREILENAASNANNSTLTNTTQALLTSQVSNRNSYDDDVFAESSVDGTITTASKSKSSFDGWFGPTKEQRKAQQEFEKWQKSFKEKIPEEGISLPSKYLPSAWACLLFLSTLAVHALFHLLCHWLVSFKAVMLFKPATKVDDTCYVLVVPPPNRGKSEFVKLKKSSLSAILQLEFQRQTYVYTSSAKLGDQARKYPNGVFTLYQSPVSFPLPHYVESKGLTSETEIDQTVEKWGKNHLSVHVASFLELLQKQLLSPLAIFQVFCALLWLLDEYWTYTLFSLASVVIFESTSVFQRTRTQAMLGGMSPKSAPVYIYRCKKWVLLSTKDLLPGDLFSISYQTRSAGPTAVSQPTPTGTPAGQPPGGQVNITSMSDIVPCDCLLLTGSAIVNEASLTGESVPQMKEAVTEEFDPSTHGDDAKQDKASEKLDMNGMHRVHTLFSGTSIITIRSVDGDARSDENAASQLGEVVVNKREPRIPHPPDSGALAYVLRTGFSSSQGALLQMIEFSQQSVTGDSAEIGFALLLLFAFAIAASAYVLKEGLRKKEKTTHEILLKCVIIITSVVPKELPMQMAMAVNMAMMTLTKAGIFCTEPHRVPLAGKISHCLFDKTGTLTTDQLVPVGIIHPMSDSTSDLDTVSSASSETAMILAACHSLVVVDPSTTTAKSSDGVHDDEDEQAKPVTGSGSNGPNQPTEADKKANELQLIGDPIEVAAIKGVEWSWHAQSSTASPGAYAILEKAIALIEGKIASMKQSGQAVNTAENPAGMPPSSQMSAQQRTQFLDQLTQELQHAQERLAKAKSKAKSNLYQKVTVVQRYHFSSQLQRMSVLCKCFRSETSPGEWYAFVKGSPEAIGTLLLPDQTPSWYKATYEKLARRGLRVLALAYKKVNLSATDKNKSKDLTRAAVECDLSFGGFIAFECKTRADSKIVVQSLQQSGHTVAMLTGDSLLTSLHIAKQVSICSEGNKTLVLSSTSDNSSVSKPCWLLRNDLMDSDEVIPFSVETLEDNARRFDLLTTEKELLAVIESTGGKESALWQYIDCFKVFARMSPPGKATVIRAIQNPDFNLIEDQQQGDVKPKKVASAYNKTVKRKGRTDAHVLMCGDGGNDVGALKQADVGLALLAGHANTNTTDDVSTSKLEKISDSNRLEGATAEESLNAHEKTLQKRTEAFNQARVLHMKQFQAAYQKQQAVEYQNSIRELTEKGEMMKIWSLTKDNAMKLKKALEDENRRYMAVHGHVWDPKDGDGLGGAAGTGGIQGLMQQLEASGGDSTSAGQLPTLRPGDASIAAPFTSRTPSVRSVIDLIRQGRCTLLSALMQQQIMMLESIISAYTLSALSLHNARSSERQMMASSWLIMIAAVSFSYASPLDQMHPLRPLRSLFHPAIIFSILGQAAIHITCMTLAVRWSTDAMGPEKLKEVTEFFKKVKTNEIDKYSQCGEDDMVCQLQAYWSAPFLPNLLNTVVFLVQTAMMISVFFTNYKGRPWMKGMLENHFLFLSVFLCVGGVVAASWEFFPQLNEMIQLTPFPDDAFRYQVIALVMSTIAGTFLWDRVCVLVFSPSHFIAIWKEFMKTTPADFIPIFKTIGKILIGLLLLGSGNIVLIIGAIYFYRTYMMKPNATIPSAFTS